MFYTVTLPATLWFFDKSKEGSNKKVSPLGGDLEGAVLFIDARNIFRQVTRALREFTEEHIQNIATIARLYRGEKERLTDLIAQYQAQADDFEQQARALTPSVKAAIGQFENAQTAVETLQKQIDATPDKAKSLQTDLSKANRELNRALKDKEELERQHKALVDKQQYYLGQGQWLKDRFPNGIYEDVTGLCKAASLAEIEEQDWSLNPGRYVGVVIEEDGLTEEEFLNEMKQRHATLNALNLKASALEKLIDSNLMQIL